MFLGVVALNGGNDGRTLTTSCHIAENELHSEYRAVYTEYFMVEDIGTHSVCTN